MLNTLRRFEREGRGASIEAMASIQGGLPQGLAAIHARFGDAVGFRLFDRRGGLDQLSERRGWEHLSELESEGTYEQLKLRLAHALDGHEAAGTFGADAIRQARGLGPPLARDRELPSPDGRQSSNPRPSEAERAQPALTAVAETGRAESAQARAIEAERARLRDQSVDGRYQAALHTYLQAYTERIERIEDRLETLVENQQAALGELETQRPGFFSSPRAKAAWSANLDAAQDRLQTLQRRLSQVEDLEDQANELAEDKLREREPELVRTRDLAKRIERGTQEERRVAARPVLERGRDQERGLELER